MTIRQTAENIVCPSCGSRKVWKDGLRRNGPHMIQRWLCRDCGYRFSLNHKKTKEHTLNYQVCALEAKNLATVETRKKWAAGATTDLKSTLFNFMWFLKKQGKAESTIRLYVEVLGVLIKRGAHVDDPESVKKVIAMQESWGASRKNNAVKAYSAFIEMHGLTWVKPKYKVPEKLPFIPTESELDSLIACCSKQMGTFLQTLKETAGRRGEVFNIRWIDIDFATNTIRITPEKGSNPRIIRISMKLARMLNSLPRIAESDKVWVYKNAFYLDKQFRRQRKRIAHKLANPRILRIHFHTFRHWKATMLCHETNGNVYYVMKFLGHKNIKNTMRYIHLWQALFPQSEEYTCEIAGNPEEMKKLIEAGFEYVTEMDGKKFFRKRETSLVGSSTIQKGSSASLDVPSAGDISRKLPSFFVFFVVKAFLVYSGGSESKFLSKPSTTKEGMADPEPQKSGTDSRSEQSAPFLKPKLYNSAVSSARLEREEKKSLLEAEEPIRESAQNLDEEAAES